MTNFLDATTGSTHATNVAVTTYMPPEHATTVLDICDHYQAQQTELQRLRAELQRLKPDDKHARDCKTQQKETLVLLALDNARLRADVEAAGWCHRIGLVRDHIRKHPDRYGKKVPCHKTVKAILQKHGYL